MLRVEKPIGFSAWAIFVSTCHVPFGSLFLLLSFSKIYRAYKTWQCMPYTIFHAETLSHCHFFFIILLCWSGWVSIFCLRCLSQDGFFGFYYIPLRSLLVEYFQHFGCEYVPRCNHTEGHEARLMILSWRKYLIHVEFFLVRRIASRASLKLEAWRHRRT